MTAGSPPSTTATTEFVVPRSMPITFAMSCSLLSECLDHVAAPAGRAIAARTRRRRGGAALGRLDLDLLRLGLLCLRQRHRQYPVSIGRLDLSVIDRRGQRERTLDLAAPALATVVAPFLDIAGPLSLALDGEHVVGEGQVDVLLAEPRQLGGDHELVLGLVHIGGRSPHALDLPEPGGWPRNPSRSRFTCAWTSVKSLERSCENGRNRISAMSPSSSCIRAIRPWAESKS